MTQSGAPDAASFRCEVCGQEYALEEGIVRFVQYSELPESDRRFARFYDWFSYGYLLFSRVASAFLGGEEKIRREILDRLDLGQGRVLEVSIGPGVNLPYLASSSQLKEMYGLDLSLGQLRRCRDFAGRRGYRVHLSHGTAECLPYQDESFDCVFHIGGINFFSDKKKAIAEMIRVAKPGALILIADETERGARGYEITLPGFSKLFEKKREPIHPPLDLIPPEMEDICLDETVWRGWFYTIEFRKPREVSRC